jgi:hypothetical protein
MEPVNGGRWAATAILTKFGRDHHIEEVTRCAKMPSGISRHEQPVDTGVLDL